MSTPRDHMDQSATSTPSAGEEKNERQLRQERILDAATTLLIRWGYRKTTIDDVAREAGVGKGTIYLHWKDKTELFQAAIWRASVQVTEEAKALIAADPQGGLIHRFWTHGMMAILRNPLLAKVMQGNSDIFQGFIGTLPQATVIQAQESFSKHFSQLQQAGLVRRDISVAIAYHIFGVLKLGLIHMAEFSDQADTPPYEDLTEAMSDLIRRWLEPEHLPADSTMGKAIINDWMDQVHSNLPYNP